MAWAGNWPETSGVPAPTVSERLYFPKCVNALWAQATWPSLPGWIYRIQGKGLAEQRESQDLALSLKSNMDLLFQEQNI